MTTTKLSPEARSLPDEVRDVLQVAAQLRDRWNHAEPNSDAEADAGRAYDACLADLGSALLFAYMEV